MKIVYSTAIAQLAWFLALTPVKAADDPIRIEINIDEIAPFRGAIALTITYTNTSEKTVTLMAGGEPSNAGFPGETFEITTKTGRKTYTVFGVDPVPLRTMIRPGKSWKRTIKDLAPLLSNSGVEIDGEMRKPEDPLPDPFGQPGKYAIRVLFDSTIKNEPDVFDGELTSNTVELNVELR